VVLAIHIHGRVKALALSRISGEHARYHAQRLQSFFEVGYSCASLE
jgi:hypothetical protein